MTTSTTLAPEIETGRLARIPFLRPLAERDFRLLWGGESISLLGDQFHFVALATLVLVLTGSGLALGTVLFAASIPRAAFILVGGALTDRFSPRVLMLASNILRGVTVGVLAALVLTGAAELWHLVVIGVVFGAVDAIFYPALNSIIPFLVPVDRLPAATGLVHGTSQLMALIGPATAGLLVTAVGVGSAFVIDAASFGIAALALFAIRGGGRAIPHPGTTAAAEPAAAAPSLLASIRAGAAYALADPAIRTLILLSAAFNLAFTGPVMVGIPWLANVRFDGGPALLGLLFAGFGGGALVGAVLAGSLGAPRRQGVVILSIAAVLGLAIALIGLVPAAALVAIVLVIAGLGVGYINVLVIAWLQARVDPAMLGRVMSLVMLGSVGLAPVSLALAGLLVDEHATALFVVAGAAVLAAVLSGAASRAHEVLT